MANKATKRRPRTRALAWHAREIPPSVLDERFKLLEELDTLKETSNREFNFKRALRDDEQLRKGHPAADLLRLRLARNRLTADFLKENGDLDQARAQATSHLREVAGQIGVHKAYLWSRIPSANERARLLAGGKIKSPSTKKPFRLIDIGMRDLALYVRTRWELAEGRPPTEKRVTPKTVLRVSRALARWAAKLDKVFNPDLKAEARRALGPEKFHEVRRAVQRMKRAALVLDSWLEA